jgi:hypothetical protein
MKFCAFTEPAGSLPCLGTLLDRIEPSVPNSYLTTYVSKTSFNIALTSTPGFLQCYLPFRFPDEMLDNFLHAWLMYHLLDLITSAVLEKCIFLSLLSWCSECATFNIMIHVSGLRPQ